MQIAGGLEVDHLYLFLCSFLFVCLLLLFLSLFMSLGQFCFHILSFPVGDSFVAVKNLDLMFCFQSHNLLA